MGRTYCARWQKCTSGRRTRSRRMTMPRHLRERIGRSEGGRPLALVSARFLLHARFAIVETRLLILNADPVFEDKSLAIFDLIDEVETHIARTLSEAVSILLGENFDAFVVEGESTLAVEQATNARQHFPSLKIVGLVPEAGKAEAEHRAHCDQAERAPTETGAEEVRAFARETLWNGGRGDRSLPFAHWEVESIFGSGNSTDELFEPAERTFHIQIRPGQQRDLSAARVDTSCALWFIGGRSGTGGDFPMAARPFLLRGRNHQPGANSRSSLGTF